MKLILVGVLIAGAGLIAGAVAQTVTAGDTPLDIRAAASVRDCPSGSVLTTYSSGSRVYAVARTESSDWIQVRDLASPDRTVWVAVGDVALDQDVSGLPVADCPQFDGTVTALGDDTTTTSSMPDTTTTSSVPDTTTTSSVPDTTTTSSMPDTTTTSSTTPPPTTPPTLPDTTPPTISQESVSPKLIWENDTQSLSCPPASPREAVVSAVVVDDTGVASVEASWTIGGTPMTKTMILSAGTYTATFGPFDTPTIEPVDPFFETVTVTITARDVTGNTSNTAREVTVNSVWECFG